MENFIAADENRINLWNLERAGDRAVYNLLDYDRQKVSEEDEIVMSAKFNNTGRSSSSIFLYSTSKGHIRICDFRESSNFQSRASLEFSLRTRKSVNGRNIFDKWLKSGRERCMR